MHVVYEEPMAKCPGRSLWCTKNNEYVFVFVCVCVCSGRSFQRALNRAVSVYNVCVFVFVCVRVFGSQFVAYVEPCGEYKYK